MESVLHDAEAPPIVSAELVARGLELIPIPMVQVRWMRGDSISMR